MPLPKHSRTYLTSITAGSSERAVGMVWVSGLKEHGCPVRPALLPQTGSNGSCCHSMAPALGMGMASPIPLPQMGSHSDCYLPMVHGSGTTPVIPVPLSPDRKLWSLLPAHNPHQCGPVGCSLSAAWGKVPHPSLSSLSLTRSAVGTEPVRGCRHWPVGTGSQCSCAAKPMPLPHVQH